MKTAIHGGVRKAARIILAGSLGLTLQACNETIDIRQAHVEQGLIYKKDASNPFSGAMNNVSPAEVGKRYIVAYQQFDGSCTVPVKNGLFDGVAECKNAAGKKFGEFPYNKGALDGTMKMWATDTGNLMMSMTVRGGVNDGLEERFNPKSGKIISRVNYSAGNNVGEEKHWDITGETLLTDLTWENGKRTGVLRSGAREEHYKAGAYDGVWKMCQWSSSLTGERLSAALSKDRLHSALTEKLGGTTFLPALADSPADVECKETVYKDGKQVVAAIATASNDSGDACLDAKIAAFRKENGEEAPINHAVIEEWEAGCKK